MEGTDKAARMARVFIIGDNQITRSGLRKILENETAIHVRFDNHQLWIDDKAQEALSNYKFVSSGGLFEFIEPDVLQVRMGTRYVRKH